MAGGGEDEEVTLLGHWGSAYVTRVRLALHLKGVSYAYVEEDLRNKSDLLLRCNPVHRAVPVLIHNGRPICESQIILQYIDEAFGPPALLPTGPHERAIALFWAAYADDVLGAPWEKAYRAGTEEERAGWMRQVVAATDALERGLSECTDGGRKGCFFGGERVGFVVEPGFEYRGAKPLLVPPWLRPDSSTSCSAALSRWCTPPWRSPGTCSSATPAGRRCLPPGCSASVSSTPPRRSCRTSTGSWSTSG